MIFNVNDKIQIQTQHITVVEAYEANSISRPHTPMISLFEQSLGTKELDKYAEALELWERDNEPYTRYKITLVCGSTVSSDTNPLLEEEL